MSAEESPITHDASKPPKAASLDKLFGRGPLTGGGKVYHGTGFGPPRGNSQHAGKTHKDSQSLAAD